jgi:hypothetical protein
MATTLRRVTSLDPGVDGEEDDGEQVDRDAEEEGVEGAAPNASANVRAGGEGFALTTGAAAHTPATAATTAAATISTISTAVSTTTPILAIAAPPAAACVQLPTRTGHYVMYMAEAGRSTHVDPK